MIAVITSGRGSNFTGATLVAATLLGFASEIAFTDAGFAIAAFAAGAAGDGFAAVVLGFGLGCFTFTFDVAVGVDLG
jgi:hypothetical protein